VSNGTLVLNADGTFTYTPNANFNGSDSFTYEISDGNGGTAQAGVMLTINPVDDPIDGDLLAAVGSLGEPGPLGSEDTGYGETVRGGESTIEDSVVGGGEVVERGRIGILSAHPEANSALSYLGFRAANVIGTIDGDGAIDDESSGNGDTWATYRRRAIDWLVSASYLGDGFDDPGQAQIVVGDLLGANGFGAESLADSTGSDGHGMKLLMMDGLQFATVALTVGAVGWAIRAGGLLTSLLLGMPIWREFDPLPVVSEDEDERYKATDEDDEGLSEEEDAAHLLDTNQFRKSELLQ
ncbi:MAG: cadherin-like domain-containing protein, partial [Burkholderiales bacterium]